MVGLGLLALGWPLRLSFQEPLQDLNGVLPLKAYSALLALGLSRGIRHLVSLYLSHREVAGQSVH